MPRIDIPVSNGFYTTDTLPLSGQCTNWYVDIPQVEGALSAGSLFGCAGLSQIATTGEINQVNRGLHVKAGKPYLLNGDGLVRLDSVIDAKGVETFSTVSLGTIAGNTRVSTADNGKQLMILIPGGNGYIIDETSGSPFLQITDASFTANGVPQLVVFIDSFFVVTTDSKKFIRSDANNGLSWDALAVFSAESDPDIIVAPHVYKNKLYIAGSETIEEFQNVGGNFQRTGFFLSKGVYSKFSMVSTADSFMWIGGGTNESPAIWSMVGNAAQKVSTTAIDRVLQKFTQEQIENAFVYSYAQKGAYFVGFSFPSRTFELNVATNKWNERKSQIVNTKGLTETIRWRANSIGTAYNRVICGDSQTGVIGSLEVDTYVEYDRPIIRRVSLQPLADLGNAISVPQLEITMNSGSGDLTIENPSIRLRTSKDGHIFSDALTRHFGAIGDYFKRCIWYRLGRFPRYAIFEFTMSDPVDPTIVKVEANVRSGQNGN